MYTVSGLLSCSVFFSTNILLVDMICFNEFVMLLTQYKNSLLERLQINWWALLSFQFSAHVGQLCKRISMNLV